MKQYIPYLILSIPFCAMGLLWVNIPPTIVIHTASADRIVDRADFGGVVVATTVVVALISCGLVQLESLFHPMTRQQFDKAYLITCSGAAFLGLVVLCLGIISR